MNTRDKSDLGSRLKRIAGQVAGIERMVNDDRPLLDVITQVRAVRAALSSVTNVLLTAHVEERATALTSTSQRERRELVGELVRLFQKRDS